MESTGIYELNVWCKNCEFRGLISIPKGTEFGNNPCPTCGVASLERVREQARITPHIEDYR